jgi:hypothetical protein
LLSPSRHHVRVWAAFAGLAAVALAARYLMASRQALYADEIYILFLARQGFAGMMAVVAQDVEQPLYFVLVWLWRALGGEGALWAKSLPILAGVAGVLAVVPLGRRMFGPRAAWLAAALLALQRTHIDQSQKLIPSTVLWLLLTLALWMAWAWFADRRARQAVGFVLFAAAALYTYYFAIFPLAVLAGYGLVRLWREPAARSQWLGLCALVMLLFAPLLPTWWAQTLRDIQADAWLPPMSTGQLWTLAEKLLYRSRAVMALLLAFSALALVPRARRGAAVLLVCLTVFPVVVPWLMSREGVHLFFWGQMQFALPFVCLLIAAGVEALPHPALAWIARGALVVIGLRGALISTAPTRPDAHMSAVDYLHRHARRGDLVVCVEPHSMLFFEYHLPGMRYRLISTPGVEPFHYSDAVLAIADSERTTPAEWSAEVRRQSRWWGLRFEHFPLYRTGAEAAAAFTAAARGPVWRRDMVTVWAGAPFDSVTPPPAVAR